MLKQVLFSIESKDKYFMWNRIDIGTFRITNCCIVLNSTQDMYKTLITTVCISLMKTFDVQTVIDSVSNIYMYFYFYLHAAYITNYFSTTSTIWLQMIYVRKHIYVLDLDLMGNHTKRLCLQGSQSLHMSQTIYISL